MLKRILAVLVLASAIVTTGCEPRLEPTNIEQSQKPVQSSQASQIEQDATCKQLTLATTVMEDTEKEMQEQYSEEYFKTEEWTAFVDGYWKGFWEQHKYCKICQENGDVPTEE